MDAFTQVIYIENVCVCNNGDSIIGNAKEVRSVAIIHHLIVLSVVLLGGLPMLLIFVMLWAQKRRELRDSPLTRALLRPPGHSLREKIWDIETDITILMILASMVPVLVYATHLTDSYISGEPESTKRIIQSVVVGIILSILAGWKIRLMFYQLKLLVLGLEGELATGEELNQLMLEGCRVFHDIPFPYGNIDHVVISQSGVFAVNAKLLGKPKAGDHNAEITVDHERGIIHFPDRVVRIPVEKLDGESKWLRQFLTSAVGRPVDVESILALPGWFIKERIGKGSVFVINPCKPKKFFVQNRIVLSPELIQQVAHQLEQLCRSVKPSFQSKRERWEDKK